MPSNIHPPIQATRAEPPRMLLVGGTPDRPGGVSVFCRRAVAALKTHGPFGEDGAGSLTYIPAGTAHRSVRGHLASLSTFARVWRLSADNPFIWLQYGNIRDLMFLGFPRRRGTTVVVTPHLSGEWRSLKHPILRRISVWLLSRADDVALLSPTQAVDLKDVLGKTPHAAALTTFLPDALWRQTRDPAPAQARSLKLIHAARLSSDKGTFRFLDLCRTLYARGIPFQATLAGTGSPEVEQQLAQVLTGQEAEDWAADVHRPGMVGEEELMTLLTTHDILVHLSLTDSYPLIVLEALGCGVFPIVHPLRGASHIIARYTGFAVGETGGVEGAAEFIARTDVAQLNADAAAAAVRVRADHAWDICASQILALWSGEPGCGRAD